MLKRSISANRRARNHDSIESIDLRSMRLEETCLYRRFPSVKFRVSTIWNSRWNAAIARNFESKPSLEVDESQNAEYCTPIVVKPDTCHVCWNARSMISRVGCRSIIKSGRNAPQNVLCSWNVERACANVARGTTVYQKFLKSPGEHQQ